MSSIVSVADDELQWPARTDHDARRDDSAGRDDGNTNDGSTDDGSTDDVAGAADHDAGADADSDHQCAGDDATAPSVPHAAGHADTVCAVSQFLRAGSVSSTFALFWSAA